MRRNRGLAVPPASHRAGPQHDDADDDDTSGDDAQDHAERKQLSTTFVAALGGMLADSSSALRYTSHTEDHAIGVESDGKDEDDGHASAVSSSSGSMRSQPSGGTSDDGADHPPDPLTASEALDELRELHRLVAQRCQQVKARELAVSHSVEHAKHELATAAKRTCAAIDERYGRLLDKVETIAGSRANLKAVLQERNALNARLQAALARVKELERHVAQSKVAMRTAQSQLRKRPTMTHAATQTGPAPCATECPGAREISRFMGILLDGADVDPLEKGHLPGHLAVAAWLASQLTGPSRHQRLVHAFRAVWRCTHSLLAQEHKSRLVSSVSGATSILPLPHSQVPVKLRAACGPQLSALLGRSTQQCLPAPDASVVDEYTSHSAEELGGSVDHPTEGVSKILSELTDDASLLHQEAMRVSVVSSVTALTAGIDDDDDDVVATTSVVAGSAVAPLVALPAPAMVASACAVLCLTSSATLHKQALEMLWKALSHADSKRLFLAEHGLSVLMPFLAIPTSKGPTPGCVRLAITVLLKLAEDGETLPEFLDAFAVPAVLAHCALVLTGAIVQPSRSTHRSSSGASKSDAWSLMELAEALSVIMEKISECPQYHRVLRTTDITTALTNCVTTLEGRCQDKSHGGKAPSHAVHSHALLQGVGVDNGHVRDEFTLLNLRSAARNISSKA